MTIDQALALKQGDYVTHGQDQHFGSRGPARRPIRITEVWVNAQRTIVYVRLASVVTDAWLDALGYDLPPEGQVYDRVEHEWITRAELASRKTNRAEPQGALFR